MPTYRVKYDVVMGPQKGTVREEVHVLSDDDLAVAMALADEGEDELVDVTDLEADKIVFPQQPGVAP